VTTIIMDHQTTCDREEVTVTTTIMDHLTTYDQRGLRTADSDDQTDSHDNNGRHLTAFQTRARKWKYKDT